MKNITRFLIILTVMFQACKENEIIPVQNLTDDLQYIENQVEQGTLNLNSLSVPFEQIQMDFIIDLSNLNHYKDIDNPDEESSKLVKLYNQNLLKSGINLENENRILTETETSILNSYVKSLKANYSLSKIKIAEYYINNVQRFDYISEESKNFIIYSIGFHRSLMIFVDIDNTENNNEKSASSTQWRPCATRDCFDCCMFRWSQSMDDWNLVDWAQFLSNPAVATAWQAGSCGYDCIFSQE